MQSQRTFHVTTLAAFATLAWASPAPAQVPPGSYVVSSFKKSGGFVPGPGGLFVVDPSTGNATSVSGLGSDLTGGASSKNKGANSVLYVPLDGSLIVGELTPKGAKVDLHRIHVGGTRLLSDEKFYLGDQTASEGGVVQAALMPDGRILVAVFGIGTGPLAGASLGIVDLPSGAVTPVPVSPPVGGVNALCLDSTGSTAWFAADNATTPATSTLYQLSVPAGGAPLACPGTLCNLVAGLAFDDSNQRVVAGGFNGTCPDSVLEVDPSSCSITPCFTGVQATNGVALVQSTGDVLLAAVSGGQYGLYRVPNASCAPLLVSWGPIGGWGALSGVTVAEPGSGPAVSYCTAGTSASGCSAALAATGTPSASAPGGFWVTAANVEGMANGQFYYGTSGRQANPWGNGTSYQCVVPPVKRGGLLVASGTPLACDGSFVQDLNARWCSGCPKPLHNPGAGALVQAQLWYRDPQNTSNHTTSLSDALEFVVQP